MFEYYAHVRLFFFWCVQFLVKKNNIISRYVVQVAPRVAQLFQHKIFLHFRYNFFLRIGGKEPFVCECDLRLISKKTTSLGNILAFFFFSSILTLSLSHTTRIYFFFASALTCIQGYPNLHQESLTRVEYQFFSSFLCCVEKPRVLNKEKLLFICVYIYFLFPQEKSVNHLQIEFRYM